MVDQQRTCLIVVIIVLAILSIRLPLAICATPISLEYNDEPLEDVLERVSTASGFNIVVNGQGRETPVSGKIENLSLEEAVRNILKRFNFTVVWDEENKEINISVYDGSMKEEAGNRIPTTRGIREPARFNPYTSQPTNDRDVSFQQTDRRGVTISGEGWRFIEGTRTTGP